MKYLALAIALMTGACASSSYGLDPDTAAVTSMPEPVYRLAATDKVRINVFNEPTLSGEFTVPSDGQIAFPLVGQVDAGGKTAAELSDALAARLANGYLRDPKVTTEVLTFRPFYVLGEVNKAGELPYTPGLTVDQAIASAQGFTYRANKNFVLLTRQGSNQEVKVPVGPALKIYPGDTVKVVERYF
ncbi:MAG: polysaccharide export protein [Sphingomonas bacterium]|nr:polysaccharide export protein [Sphingomonas bacterium]